MDDEQPCRGVRKDGSPCRAKPRPGRHLCWAHDASLGGKRQKAREKGGRNKRTEVRLTKLLPAPLASMLALLTQAAHDVYEGKLDPRCGVAIATISTAMVRVYEADKVEDRLVALEKAARLAAPAS